MALDFRQMKTYPPGPLKAFIRERARLQGEEKFSRGNRVTADHGDTFLS